MLSLPPVLAEYRLAPNATPCISLPSRLAAIVPPTWVPCASLVYLCHAPSILKASPLVNTPLSVLSKLRLPFFTGSFLLIGPLPTEASG